MLCPGSHYCFGKYFIAFNTSAHKHLTTFHSLTLPYTHTHTHTHREKHTDMYTQITDQNSSLLQFHLAFTSAGLAHTHYTDIEVCVLRNKGDLPGSCHLYGQHFLAFLQLDWELFPNITLCTDERKRFRGCWLARERTCVCVSVRVRVCVCVFFLRVPTSFLTLKRPVIHPSVLCLCYCSLSFILQGWKKDQVGDEMLSLLTMSLIISVCVCVCMSAVTLI